jgi:hypothetical protein
MNIIPSKQDFWNTPTKKKYSVPLILSDGASCLYLLIKDVSKELEDFILTGKTQTAEFHVLSAEQERTVMDRWKQMGLTVTYHRQRIEYMYREVTITYLCVGNPATGMKISLIPWFMLPRRPYPIFAYIYAIWYYQTTGKKSLSQSAATAGKLFGIDTLNKSTVSRNIKAMEHFNEISQIDKPLSTDGPETPSDKEVIECIPEILGSDTSVESLERRYGQRIKRLPEPIQHTGAAQDVLSAIPGEFSQVIKNSEPPKKKTRDVRKRPGRPRSKGSQRVQRQPDFVGAAQIEKKRRRFIEICRSMVLNATAVYHRFLI